MARQRKARAGSAALKQRWRTALADAGMSEAQWAESEGLTKSHVAQVIKGDRQSARLMEKAMAFIVAREKVLAKRLVASGFAA